MVFLGAMAFMLLLLKGVEFERDVLVKDFAGYVEMLGFLAVAAAGARWFTVAMANSDEAVVEFEAVQQPAVFVIGLYRDGVLPIKPSQSRE